MRSLAVGLLAFLAGGCAATAPFDLVPHEVGVPWVATEPSVRGESRNATIEASFEGSWRDWLVFDVTLVNQSDSVLRVDPSEFSFTLSSPGAHLPAKLERSFWAFSPEWVRARLDQGSSGVSILWGTLLGLEVLVAAADLVNDVAVDAQRTQQEHDDDQQFHQNWGELMASTLEAGQRREAVLSGAREGWERCALRRTDLEPGVSVSGTLALPAWPLRWLLGPDQPADVRSITSGRARREEGWRLVLRAPESVGALEIRYDVRRR